MKKQCPMCAEYVEDTDIVCKYCGYDFNTQNTETESNNEVPVEETTTPLVLKASIVAGILGFLLFVGFIINILASIDTITDIEAPKEEITKEVQSNSKLLEEGKKSFDNGDYDTAAEKFDLIIKGNNLDKKAEANYYMGSIYKSRGLYEPAQNSFKKAYELNPNYNEAKFELMLMNMDNNDYESAGEMFVELLNNGFLKKDQVAKYFGDIVQRTSIIDDCVTDECKTISTKVLSVDPYNQYALQLLMYYYNNKGDEKAYFEYKDKYLTNVKYDKYEAINLFRGYLKLEYYTKALAVLDLLEKHGHDRADLERARAQVKYMREQYKQEKSGKTNTQTTTPQNNTSNANTEDEYDPYANIQVKSEGVRYVDRNAW